MSRYEAESKRIGPYPTWEKWRHSLFGHLKEIGLDIPKNSVENVLHDWYVLRREKQLKQVGNDELRKFSKELDEERPTFFENPAVVEAFRYITERTTSTTISDRVVRRKL